MAPPAPRPGAPTALAGDCAASASLRVEHSGRSATTRANGALGNWRQRAANLSLTTGSTEQRIVCGSRLGPRLRAVSC